MVTPSNSAVRKSTSETTKHGKNQYTACQESTHASKRCRKNGVPLFIPTISGVYYQLLFCSSRWTPFWLKVGLVWYQLIQNWTGNKFVCIFYAKGSTSSVLYQKMASILELLCSRFFNVIFFSMKFL